MDLKEIRIWNIKFNILTIDEIVSYVTQWIDEGKRGIHLTGVSADVAAMAQTNNILREAILASDIVNVDSFIPAYLLKRKGYLIKDRVPSPDIFERLLIYANEHRQKVFFLGATDETLNKLKSVIESEYPGIRIEGMKNGYYKDEDEEAIAHQIANLSPDYLFLGMPTPKKEKFILKYKHEINVGVFFGIGGAFDAKAGVLKRPPEWLRKHGLEGIYRLLRKPRVYAKRLPMVFGFVKYALMND